MLPAKVWQNQASDQPYRGDTLATEGFIHCTAETAWLLKVANHYYRTQPGDFVILCIAPDCVQATVKWEKADGHEFPHIYGSLNLDAVENVVQFPRDAVGQFVLPPELSETG